MRGEMSDIIVLLRGINRIWASSKQTVCLAACSQIDKLLWVCTFCLRPTAQPSTRYRVDLLSHVHLDCSRFIVTLVDPPVGTLDCRGVWTAARLVGDRARDFGAGRVQAEDSTHLV